MIKSTPSSFAVFFQNIHARHYLSLLLFYIFSIGVFITVAYQQVRFTSESQAYVFGSTLAAQIADQASEVLVSEDRLSLNIMLNQMTKTPYIGAINIYSIDNKLLAGREFYRGSRGHIFTAPVHYQEVIAGYVRIRLSEAHIVKPARDAITMIIFAAALLLIIATLLVRHLHRKLQDPLRLLRQHVTDQDDQAFSRQASQTSGDLQKIYQQLSMLLPTSSTEKDTSDAVNAEADDQPSDQENLAQPGALAILCVRFNNLNTLQQCMAPTDFNDLLRAQLQALHQAARLYNGELQYSAEGQAYLTFPAIYNQDYLFSATCCALLLEQLMLSRKQQHQPTFALGLGMSHQEKSPEKRFEQHPLLAATTTSLAFTLALHDHRNGVAITPEAAVLMDEEERVLIEEHPQDALYRITQVHSNYQRLLEQQCQQINHHDSILAES